MGNAVWGLLGSPRGPARLLALMALLVAVEAGADSLHLRNGRVIQGIIDDQASDEVNLVINSEGVRLNIPRRNIERIEREAVNPSEMAGDTALGREDLDRALDLYRLALSDEPGSARIEEKLARVRELIEERAMRQRSAAVEQIERLVERGDYVEAIEAVGKALEQMDDGPTRLRLRRLAGEAQLGEARRMRDRLKFPEAEEFYRAAIEGLAEDPMPALELARVIERQTSRRAAAIELYELALELAPHAPANALDIVQMRYRLGELLYEAGRYEESYRLLFEMGRKGETARQPQAASLTVDSLRRMSAGRDRAGLEELAERLKPVLELWPEEESGWRLLGRLMLELERPAEARAALERALELQRANQVAASSASHQDAVLPLGQALRRLGMLNEARAVLEPAAAPRLGHYDIVCELAEIELEQAFFEAAVERFGQATRMNPNRFRGLMGLGQAHLRLGRHERAREAWSEVLKRDPQNIEAQLAIVGSYMEEHQYDLVLAEAEKAEAIIQHHAERQPDLSLARRRVELYTIQGQALSRLHRTYMARDYFEQALGIDPSNAAALLGIALSYQSDRRYDRAEEYFLKAMEAEPENPTYALSMGVFWGQFQRDPERALPYYYKYYELGGKDPAVRQWIIEAGGTPP